MPSKLSWRWTFAAAVLCTYLPFLNLRLLPTAGDEKVYVTQALEMLEGGRHFVQTLFGKPDYYKGPLHYLLIQLGQSLFGLQLIALRYMNLACILVAGLSVGSLVERHLPSPRNTSLALWAALGCAFSAGALGHVPASQMEIELLACYSLALFLLDRIEKPKFELLFWVAAGFAGWLKSPLHSALLGVSFWTYLGFRALLQGDRTFIEKLRSPRSWVFCAVGVVICIAGYLPAMILDWKSFFTSYIQRESLAKSSGNGGPGWQAWFPLFFYYLFPWNWLAAALYVAPILRRARDRTWFRVSGGPSIRPYLLVSALILPTLVFFWVHRYRGENYTYPAQGALLLLLALLWSEHASTKLVRWSHALTAIQLLVPSCLLAWLIAPHPPAWLPAGALWILIGLSLLGALATGLNLRRGSPHAPGRAALGALPYVISIYLILFWAGDREMTDLRACLRKSGPETRLCYLNLEKNIWNEAGILSFATGTRIRSCEEESQAIGHLRNGGTLIVKESSSLTQLSAHPGLQGIGFTTSTWKRWGRHSHIPTNGRSPLLELRSSGNWGALEHIYLLVTAERK